MSETKIAPPIALSVIDEQLGTDLVQAHAHAIEAAPHLNGLAVVQADYSPMFQPSELGLPGSSVSINPNKDYYLTHIRNGRANIRFGHISEFFRGNGIAPSFRELMTTALLHELGHADDLHGYIQKAGGDTKAAFDLSRQVRESELATLPLKMASSRAKYSWDNNTDGYRDRMVRNYGYTDQSFNDMILTNSGKYAELPCEAVADRFALGVLATMYS